MMTLSRGAVSQGSKVAWKTFCCQTAHNFAERHSTLTFLLRDEANQHTDGVFIQLVRYVGTAVPCRDTETEG